MIPKPSDEDNNPRKQKILLGTAVAVFLGAGGVAWYTMGGQSPEDIAANRVYICSETGKIFEYVIKEGDIEPVSSPHSHKNTGYRAEACYWTKGPDGKWKAKAKPTWVLLKSKLHPDSNERTFCPDCGHEVKGHNPMPPQEMMDAAEAEAKKK